jgi:hypothetical protein
VGQRPIKAPRNEAAQQTRRQRRTLTKKDR